jgi:O-antigen/teichoic acid export membrane protein
VYEKLTHRLSGFNLKRRGSESTRGIAAQVINLASVIGVQILQLPLFLAAVSVEAYGSYLALIALPSLVIVADFGLLSATSTRLLGQIERREFEEARELFRTTLTLLGLIVFVIVMIGLVVLPSLELSGISGISSREARWIVVSSSAYAIACLLSNLMESAMRASGSYASAWTLLAMIRMADFAVAMILLYLFSNLAVASFGFLASRLLWMIFLQWRTRQVAPWLSFAPTGVIRGPLSGMLRPTLGSAALPLGNGLLNQGLILAVTVTLGPEKVVVLSAARTLMNTLRQMTNVLTNGLLPTFTGSHVRGEHQRARRILRKLFVTNFVLICTGAVLMTFFGHQISLIWTSGSIEVPQSLLLILSFFAVLESSWIVLSIPILARNGQLSYALPFAILAALLPIGVITLKPDLIAEIAVGLAIHAALMVVIVCSILRREYLNAEQSNI